MPRTWLTTHFSGHGSLFSESPLHSLLYVCSLARHAEESLSEKVSSFLAEAWNDLVASHMEIRAPTFRHLRTLFKSR